MVDALCYKWNGREFHIFLRSVRRLLVTANVVPSSPILVTLMMEALRLSETSVLTRITRCNIPEEDDILHSHRRENLKSCRNKSVNKATQTMKTYYSQRIQHRKKKRNKAISDTGLGGLLRYETSRLSRCVGNRFAVGG
jgi:hypothetical protein